MILIKKTGELMRVNVNRGFFVVVTLCLAVSILSFQNCSSEISLDTISSSSQQSQGQDRSPASSSSSSGEVGLTSSSASASSSSSTISTQPEYLKNLGWWNIAPEHFVESPGNIVVISSDSVDGYIKLIDQAVLLHKVPWIILWTLTRDSQNHLLGSGWQDRLQSLIKARGSQIGCWYIADEPALQNPAWSINDIQEVTNALPQASCKMQSLSPPELERGDAVAQGINLIGVNIYVSGGVKPEEAGSYLNKLASYGRNMYLNLDTTVFPVPKDSCLMVTTERQQASIDLNQNMLAWAKGRKDVKALIAFLWQSQVDAGGQSLCGAQSLPTIQNWIRNLIL